MSIRKSVGFTYVELMIAIGVLAVVAASVANLYMEVQKGQIRTASTFQLSVLARNFATIVANQQSWTNTLNASANSQAMACLKARTPCTVNGAANGAPLANVPFALYDGGNQLVYNAISATNGFTLSGGLCSTYSATGNSSCPIRFALKWSAQCAPGNCVDPQVKVEADLQYVSGSVPFPLNPENFSIPPVYRAPL